MRAAKSAAMSSHASSGTSSDVDCRPEHGDLTAREQVQGQRRFGARLIDMHIVRGFESPAQPR